MGSCLRKFLIHSPAEGGDVSTSSGVPIIAKEVTRNDTAELVIAPSHFKFSLIGVGENKINNFAAEPSSRDAAFSHLMKKGCEYDCKLFAWPSPEL